MAAANPVNTVNHVNPLNPVNTLNPVHPLYVNYDNQWKHKMFSNFNSIYHDKKPNIKVGYFTVCLYGDSFFSNDRLRTILNGITHNSNKDFDLYGIRPRVLNMQTHTMHSHPTRVFNFSKGGLTFKHLFNDDMVVLNWAHIRPELTIFHIGTCDLSNMTMEAYNSMYFKTHWFFSKIIELSRFFRDNAFQWVDNQQELDYIQNYKFIFTYLADWGTDYTPRAIGMNPIELRKARNANNHFARKHIKLLYQYNIILLCLNNDEMDEQVPARLGVHLAAQSLNGFVNNLLRVICRKICARCAVRKWPKINTNDNFRQWLRFFVKGRACDQLLHDPEPEL